MAPGGVGAIYIGLAAAPKCLEGSPIASNAKAFRAHQFKADREIAPLFLLVQWYVGAERSAQVIAIYVKNISDKTRSFSGKLVGEQRDDPPTV